MFTKSINLAENKTVCISFKGLCNGFAVVRNGNKYHNRTFESGMLSEAKFNAIGNGVFEVISSQPFDIYCKKLDVFDLSKIEIPTRERSEFKPYKIVENFDLYNTPARINISKGVIETGQKFKYLNEQQQQFILLHEIGHFYYTTEFKCDVFAMYNLLKKGYNKSQAYSALKDVLSRNPQNTERIKIIFDNLNLVPIK